MASRAYTKNSTIFDEDFSMPPDPCSIIISFAAQIGVSTDQAQNPNNGTKVINVSWTRPPPGWVKLNSDGTSKGNPGDAGCGGILRGDDGQWIKGFTYHIGTCSALTAELWGIYIGTLMAWNMGYRKLVVESDSQVSINAFSKKNLSGSNRQLISRIRKLSMLPWDLKFCHTLHEGNTCADWLANHSILSDFGIAKIASPPPQLVLLMLDDASGATIPRITHM